MSNDPQLGQKIHAALIAEEIETPALFTAIPPTADVENMTRIMRDLRLNLNDDSLQNTPERVSRMYVDEIFKGLNYDNFPRATAVENKMQYSDLLTVKGIDVNSYCEHHFIPFFGRAAIGYIPDKKIMGLSKFNRIVDFFSRRPQVQERLTAQVVCALREILETDDVACVIEAQHLCVRYRGIKQANTTTITSKMEGRFMTNGPLRSEFMALIKGGN
jgi:GTP cyclohydrolase I